MKIDSHFYGVLAFCRAVGFNKGASHIVAYASQFVDDAKANQIVLEEVPEEGIKTTELSEGPAFINMATCHKYKNIDTFNFDAMMNNTTAFHFVPGCEGNNFPRKLRCKKESPIIMNILEDAKEEGDLIKLGITLHAYADTFSHQGFAGLLSKVNDISDLEVINGIKDDKFKFMNAMEVVFDGIGQKTDRLMPAYGHGQVFIYPDTPYLEWQYSYDDSEHFTKDYKTTGKIDNKDRFEEAFKKIKNHLEEFLENNPKYKEEGDFERFDVLFSTLLSHKTFDERIIDWERLYPEMDLYNKEEEQYYSYDENLWLDNAFADFTEDKYNKRIVRNAKLQDGFENSNWYNFYLAVDWYKQKFYSCCQENGLDIPYEN